MTDPASQPPRRVAHVVMQWGELSQTFVRDAIESLEARGWEGWVVAHDVANRDRFPSPPDGRLLRMTPGSEPSWRDRLARRQWTEHVHDMATPLQEIGPD